MNPVTPPICLLCHSPEHQTVLAFEQPDPYEQTVGVTPAGYSRRWVQCAQCGFYYSVYSRDPDILDTIYSAAYRGHQAGWRQASVEETFRRITALPPQESETKFRVHWIKAQLESAWAARLATRPTPPYRLLDVGGATGVFAYEFQDSAWQAHVMDPDENGWFVERTLGIPFRQQLYAPGGFGTTFHLVSLIFVLEHVRHPLHFLAAVQQDLEPGGLVYIEVPDEAAFRLKPPEDDIFNACHLWMFGPRTLLTALHASGYEILALNRMQTRRGHYTLMALAARQP